MIRTDRQRIAQILLILVSNALKFTFNGGVTIKVQDRDDKIYLEVTDTGVGIK